MTSIGKRVTRNLRQRRKTRGFFLRKTEAKVKFMRCSIFVFLPLYPITVTY